LCRECKIGISLLKTTKGGVVTPLYFNNMEGQIEIVKPVTITGRLSGKTRTEDHKYLLKWIDGTDKIIETEQFQFNTVGTILESLNHVAQLCRLNDNILEIKIKTI